MRCTRQFANRLSNHPCLRTNRFAVGFARSPVQPIATLLQLMPRPRARVKMRFSCSPPFGPSGRISTILVVVAIGRSVLCAFSQFGLAVLRRSHSHSRCCQETCRGFWPCKNGYFVGSGGDQCEG